MYAALGDLADARASFAEIACPDVVCVAAMVGSRRRGCARDLFDGMPLRDHVAWNAMIAGYVHVCRSREALRVFDEMRSAGASVGEATLVSVLTACAQMGPFGPRKVDALVHAQPMRMSVTLGTAFLDMYSKCGCAVQWQWPWMRSRAWAKGAGQTCIGQALGD
ncbi:uncharacterized protein C2845_PM07G20770 [Panicum miliaceum]|uniref:Pentatricopeptide repeat-containing protein n=1 Tax=Panicum miliaceum TaxID=4540 RepID=A0A3L6SMF7_PANMI|nr:uncharacterized protein C2845_PM07G20770 [Panicum miliaceum]